MQCEYSTRNDIIEGEMEEGQKPERFKSRVVALGNFQDEFCNPVEFHAPFIFIELVCVILYVMFHKGWNV